ncbi:MAG: tetratricopeptide repeat protein [candidate division WOR-3 bacterium]
MNCPRCGYNNPESANFCSRCGLQLTKTFGQRRPVAVIFADIAGFTPLAERMDPEEVKDLIDQCLQRLATVVQKYEGFVDKFIGDCIMAVFGAPVAHEDDPLRAVLASIDLMKEIKDFNIEKKQNLALSIGINYGLVATGDLGRPGGYTVMGDTVNLAQRLQNAAPRGKIYVSEEVYRHTCQEIVYRKLKKIPVKGKSGMIQVFTPIRVRVPYSLRKIAEIPLIGRSDEMAHLNKIFGEVKNGKGRVVGIVGEAGIGKTKLVYEFKRQLGVDAVVIEGKGIEYHSNSSYFVLREILKKIFGINEKDSPETMARRIAKTIEELDDAVLRTKISFYKYFLSADLTETERRQLEAMPAEERSRLLMEAIHSLILKYPRSRPLVIIFDDCHWVDNETINFMHTLAHTIGYKPIMLIALYRPSFDIGRTGELPYFSMLNLKPLEMEETAALLKKIFNCERIEDELLALLLKKSGSIPFYLSELAINLSNTNMIQIKDGCAYLASGATFSLPRSLDELIMTKVDRLAPELRAIVNIAAVIGEEFSFKLLQALLPSRERLHKNLLFLTHQNIFKIIESTGLPEENKYGFTHTLIRDAVYNSLLKKELKSYHQKVGFAIEKIFGFNLEEYYDTLAHHFYLGGELLKALDYLEKAGDKKRDFYLNNAAIEIYQRCLSIIPSTMPQRIVRIKEKLGSVYELIGDYKNALETYQSIKKYAESDRLTWARSLKHQALIYYRQGIYEKAMKHLHEARKELRRISDSQSILILKELSEISSWESWFYRIKGKIDLAEKKALESINIIKKVKKWSSDPGLKKTMLVAYNNLAIVHQLKGEPAKAIALCERALTIAHEIGEFRGQRLIYNTLGIAYRMQGEYDKAIDAFTMYLKISEELEDKHNIGIAYCNLGNVYQDKGDSRVAIDFYHKFLKISEELGDKSGVGTAINNIGIVYFNEGDYQRALESFEQYLKISRKLGEKQGVAIAYGNLGEIYYHQFKFKKAMELFKKYLRIAQQLNARRDIAMASYNLGRIYTEMGNLNLAQRYLEQARRLFENVGNKFAIGMVLNTLGYLKFKQGKFDESKKFLNAAQEIANLINSAELKVYCLLNFGIFLNKTDPLNAEKNFQEAILLCEKNRFKKLLADVYYEYARFLGFIRRRSEMKKYYQNAMRIYRSMGIKRR